MYSILQVFDRTLLYSHNLLYAPDKIYVNHKTHMPDLFNFRLLQNSVHLIGQDRSFAMGVFIHTLTVNLYQKTRLRHFSPRLKIFF